MSAQDVVCKIFGENLDTLALYADKMSKIVKTVEGTTDLYVETVTGIPQVVVQQALNSTIWFKYRRY
jgi:cobalt-zinc-cadmium resistance protein CzcA